MNKSLSRTFEVLFFCLIISSIVTAQGGVSNSISEWDFSTAVTISRTHISSLPYRSLEDILSLQNGVVVMRDRDDLYSSSETELHVRGGRDYENGFFLNGVNVVDPISGVYTANFSTRALDDIEFYSGGFSAQFGNANSSIMNISTVSGGERVSGFAEIQSDNELGSDFGQNKYLLSFEGPITKSKNLRFFGLVERTDYDDRYPSPITEDALLGSPNRIPKNWLEGWTYHGKLSFELSPVANLTAFVDGSNQEWSEYLHEYYFDSVHTPYHDDDNLSIGAKIAGDIIPNKTSYAVGGSFFRSERFQGDGVYRENLWAYGRPAGNPGNDNTNLFRYWDNGQTDSLGNQIITPTVTDTILVDGQSRIFVMSGDEGHVYNNYLRHKADIFSLSGKISHSFKEWHWGSLGLEYKRSTIRYYQHLIPTNVWQGISGNGFIDAINYGYDDLGVESENTNWENEPKQPTNLSAYLDNIFKIGIIELRPSIRVDRWGLDALRLRNPVRPLDPDTTNDVYAQTLELSDMEKVDPNTKFSPRLSVGADIFNATRVQANAGIYYQLPPYAYLYNDFGFFEYKILTGGYFIPLANSALKPEKSTQVELEISHEFSRMVKVEVAGYLKWTRDQIQISTQPSLPRSFATYRNSDKSDIQGFEVGLNIRDGRNKSFELRYSFSNVDGIGSYPSTQSNIAWINTTPLDEMAPLDYDQRHKLTWILQLDYRGRGKYDQSFQILNEVLFNAVMSYNSSLPHTPIQISNEASLFPFAPIAIDETNSRRMKDRLTIDIRVERNIFIRGFEISPFVTITNLLDKKNVSNVWSYSGLPNSTGWLQTSDGQQFIQNTNTPDYNGLNGEEKYYIKEQLPGHYYAPRQFFFGLRGTF